MKVAKKFRIGQSLKIDYSMKDGPLACSSSVIECSHRLVAVSVNLNNKHCTLGGIADFGGGPGVEVDLPETSPCYPGSSLLMFPELVGWYVFAVNVVKYELRICFSKI